MRLRRPGFLLVGVLSSAAFAWLALREVSLSKVVASLREADYEWLLPALALTFVAGWLRAVRWRLLFSKPNRVSVADAFGAISIGLMFNNLLPSRAGEVPRTFALRRATGFSAFEIAATIVVERVLDVFVLALTGVMIWPLLPDESWIRALGLVCLGLVVGFLATLALVAALRERLPRLLVRILAALPFISEQRATGVRQGVGAGVAILLRPRRLLEAVCLSFAIWIVVGLSAWVLFPAFGLEAGALAAGLLLVAASFALSIPSSPGAIGVYEASVQASLVAFAVPPSAALSYALVLHGVNFFPILLVGAVAALIMGRRAPHRPLVRPPPGGAAADVPRA